MGFFLYYHEGTHNLKTGSFLMDGSGTDDERARVPYLTAIPVTVDNGSMWAESDGLHVYLNGAEGILVPMAGTTTTVVEITSTGAGTAVDYGSSTPKRLHNLEIVGQTNTGTFTSATVDFEISLDGTNFKRKFTLKITGAGIESFDIEVPAVKVRYNVTAIDVTGDADLDVTITSQ